MVQPRIVAFYCKFVRNVMGAVVYFGLTWTNRLSFQTHMAHVSCISAMLLLRIIRWLRGKLLCRIEMWICGALIAIQNAWLYLQADDKNNIFCIVVEMIVFFHLLKGY